MGHPPRPARSPWHRARRALLALLALGALSPAVGAGCAGGFDPPSVVDSLRVFTVTATGDGMGKSYANPGDEITFKMSYRDGYPDPEDGPRPVQIVWLGGCFNPPGDQYFSCYEQLAESFAELASGSPAPPQNSCEPDCEGPSCTACCQLGCGWPECPVCAGSDQSEFHLKLPGDIVSSRPPPDTGPHYGIAYVFFAACAGEIKPVNDEGGDAGAFPLGCFNPDGQRLGAESFVPGYTQIYAFEDGRPNQNPEIQGLTMNGKELPEDFAAIPTVQRCDLSEDDRRIRGCGKEDPFTTCTTYEIEVLVDPDVAELDLESTGQDGQPLTEVVWVDYFADQGNFEADIKLVNDAVEGFFDDREVKWIPPPEPGIATLWAVLHDARGGASVMQRLIRVE